MRKKNSAALRQNWRLAKRVSSVTGREVQESRSLVRHLRSQKGFKPRKFMNDDAYLKSLLTSEPVESDLSEFEKLELAANFVKEMGSPERAMEVLDAYERIMST
jgi:hypothetical protein